MDTQLGQKPMDAMNGIKYGLTAENGFSGRSWDIRPATIKAIEKLFQGYS